MYCIILGFTLVFLLLYFYSLSQRPIVLSSLKTNTSISYQDVLKQMLQCYDKPLKFSIQEKRNYWVFYNFVRAETTHKCHESVTYSVVGDFLHIDNLIPIVQRWNGPMSVALHAAGDDFYDTLDAIAYLRNCVSPLFKKFVTFHIVMDFDHFPKRKFIR